MAKLTLYGGATYNLAGINENVDLTDQSFRDMFDANKCGDYQWLSNTKLLANFNENLSGSNFGGDFGNIVRFEVYKTIGEKSRLHKVCTTSNALQRVVEDFTVGDLCDYQYFVYAVCENAIKVDDKEVKVETIVPIVSEIIQLNTGVVSVIGLKEAGDNTYIIDENNVWQIRYNLENTGYTLNTDKTFYQTQHTYGKSSGGNRKQRSIPISGLLGKIDCSTQEFYDTYDYIIDWETFVASNTPKMLIDLRGIITIGDIDVNPQLSYQDTSKHEASVSFTFIQLNSIDNVDVLGRILPVNPLYYTYLAVSEGALLKEDRDNPDKLHSWLTSPLTEGTT